MQCPTCTSVALVMSERQGIEIDYCPQCRGVWLDRGELDKIIERTQATSAPPPAVASTSYGQSGDRHRRNEHAQHGYKKKREGFLSDLFDF